MTTHDVKCWPEFFCAIEDGTKPFDLRLNNRNYAIGDVCLFREYDPNKNDYTGRSIRRLITYVMEGVGHGAIAPLQGLQRGYCILGLRVE